MKGWNVPQVGWERFETRVESSVEAFTRPGTYTALARALPRRFSILPSSPIRCSRSLFLSSRSSFLVSCVHSRRDVLHQRKIATDDT